MRPARLISGKEEFAIAVKQLDIVFSQVHTMPMSAAMSVALAGQKRSGRLLSSSPRSVLPKNDAKVDSRTRRMLLWRHHKCCVLVSCHGRLLPANKAAVFCR